MDIVTGVLVYIMLWWIILFTTLPWGNRVPDEVEKGFASSAPEKPRLKVKLIVTTVLAAIAWYGYHLITQMDIIDFRSY